MQKQLLVILSLAITIFIVGCKKNNTSTIASTQHIYLPYSIKTYNNGTLTDSVTYKYDASNRIAETDGSSGGVTYYSYDSNDNLTEYDVYINNILNQKTILTYSSPGSVLVAYINYRSNGSILSTSNYNMTIDGNKRITRIDYGPNTYTLNTYDSNDNLTTFDMYQPSNISRPSYTTTNIFDTNKAVFSNVKAYTLGSSYSAKNNIVEQTVTTSLTSSSYSNYTINTSYMYNSDGYPISSTTTTTNSTNIQTQFYTYIIE